MMAFMPVPGTWLVFLLVVAGGGLGVFVPANDTVIIMRSAAAAAAGPPVTHGARLAAVVLAAAGAAATLTALAGRTMSGRDDSAPAREEAARAVS
jgi:hypothetical protein